MTTCPPFPYFGKKTRAAAAVWRALGSPAHYIEPFCGSCAVLLARPTAPRLETINDADGCIANVWRAIRSAPNEVARICSGPVVEVDYHARLAELAERRADLVPRLEGDPDWFDARLAAFWIYVACYTIGAPFDRRGPWRRIDGRFVRVGQCGLVSRELPLIGTASGIGHMSADGIARTMRALRNRLSSVRIMCGDWSRLVSSPSCLLAGQKTAGVYLDPPYGGAGEELYNGTASGVARDVEAWCAAAPPDVRVVLSGFAGEHDALLSRGWTREDWLRGVGYSTNESARRGEALYLSPACIRDSSLFDQLDRADPATVAE